MQIIKYLLIQPIPEHEELAEDGVTKVTVPLSFSRKPVQNLRFHEVQVLATPLETPDFVKGEEVLIDGNHADIVRSTNSYDKNGNELFEKDYVKDEGGEVYEIMNACGSMFIVDMNAKFGDKKEEPVILTDAVTRKLERIGDVWNDTERLFPIPVEVIEDMEEKAADTTTTI
jgi:hypothetical protein